MAALDSAGQICLSTSLEDVLIIVVGSSSLDFKKQRNRSCFRLYLHNQGRYGKTDGGIGFSGSNRSIYVLGRRSKWKWGVFHKYRKENSKIRDVSIYISMTRSDMAKRT